MHLLAAPLVSGKALLVGAADFPIIIIDLMGAMLDYTRFRLIPPLPIGAAADIFIIGAPLYPKL